MLRLMGSPYEPPLDPFEIEDWLLLAAVCLLPWAFGGVEIWASRTGACLLIAAGVVSFHKHGWVGLGLDRRARWLLPALLIGVWGVFQVVPLHPAVIRVLSPRAHAIYVDTFPGYPGPAPQDVLAAIEERALAAVPETADLPAPPRESVTPGAEVGGSWGGWRTLSLLPSVGIERLFWYFALLIGFLVVRQRTLNEDLAHRYRNVLFVLFVSLAIFALIYEATSNGKLYWIRSTLATSHPVGPYVGQTHFAGVMELATPWLAGYAFMVYRRTGEGLIGILRSPIFTVGAILCFAGGLITGSKFAALMLLVMLGTLFVLAAPGTRKKTLIFVLAGLVACGVYGLWNHTLLGERVNDYFESYAGINEIDRLEVWQAAISMFKDYSLSGSGYGSFREVFTYYMPTGEVTLWNQLHNDYLEVLVEGGLVAGVLLGWLLLVFWTRCLRPAAWQSSEGTDLEYWGLLLGVASLSAHAFVDFNHQIPANALLFVVLAAIAVARAESRAEDRS